MATKLLLVEDVDNLGRSGDIVNVKPGYARNFLLPTGVAIIASSSAIRRQAKLQEERAKKAETDKLESEKMAGHLIDINVTKIVKVDPKGNPYGSVSASEIIELLKDQHSIEIEKRSVQLKHPIKEIGTHAIAIKLKEGIVSSITLKVLPENHQEEQPAAKSKPAAE